MQQPVSEIDQQFMRRAIRLAMNGRGRVEPNPMVGCVIVSADGRVIGQGYHKVFGGPHAEPEALANCTESPRGATAYVTLEPCCHTHKKTPPCAPRVIGAGLARVVVGSLDPNPEVDGKGVAMLRAAGVRVDGPVLEAEAKQLIAPFIARTRLGRPYVTLKWAQTADGKVAGPRGEPMQISNERSMRLVHELRARSDAILVGINTVRADDPLLTARGVDGARPLVRVVLDSELRLPLSSRLVGSCGESPVVVYSGDYGVQEEQNRLDALRAAGVEVVAMPSSGADRPVLAHVLQDLARRGASHVMVEPGPTLAAGFFSETDLVDRLWVFRSPKVVNDPTAPAAAALSEYFVESGRVDLDGDTLTEYLNPRSPVLFVNTPSADFVLAGG
jgi:diaminohydroxyphosphoribosylaminopyrimidine deaminase/5-amino-6-(5-phosphoribosylamino)uracil reductase